MKRLILVPLLALLAGCGFARQEQKDTVERVHETTTAADGTTVTHNLTRTVSQTTKGSQTLDMSPPAGLGGIMGLIAPLIGTLGGPVGIALASALTGGFVTHKVKEHRKKNKKSDAIAA